MAKEIWRERHGYLWATDEENERIEQLVKSCRICGGAIRSKADFIRISAIVMGELLKRKTPKISRMLSEKEIIDYIINCFC